MTITLIGLLLLSGVFGVSALLLVLISEWSSLNFHFRPRLRGTAAHPVSAGAASVGQQPRAELLSFPKPQAPGLKSARRRVS